MSDELIERVAAAIAEIRELPVEGGTVPVEFGPQSAAIIATAAVRAVRQYDVDTGPSEAEIEAVGVEVLQSAWDVVQLRPWHSQNVELGLEAAAVERAREEGVG